VPSVQAGDVRIQIDTNGVIETLDRIGSGAASQFVRASLRTLESVQAAARPRWPVRTGRSRDAFEIETSVRGEQLAVSLANTATNRWGAYAYKIRWSVRTRESLTRELEAKVLSGKTAEARARLLKYWTPRITGRHGEGAPDAAHAGKQPWRVLVRQPGEAKALQLARELQTELNTLAGRT
jgi:hypothetical protein